MTKLDSSEPAKSPISLRLWTRFSAALVVLGFLSVGSHLITEWLIAENENSNAIVNISGRQRMLSQRITLLAEKLVYARDRADYHALQTQLRESINLMEKSHAALTVGDTTFRAIHEMSPEVKAMYFGPTKFIDRDVKRFINFAREVSGKKFENRSIDPDKVTRLFRMSRAGLLADLDSVVKQYQEEGEGRVQTLKNIGIISVLIIIGTLVTLAVGVFKPLFERVQKEFSEKENTQRRLEASERRQRTIVESALDGVITIDKEGRVVEFNPSALATFGYLKLEDVQGEKLENLIIPKSSRHKHVDGIARFIETGKSEILGKRIEVTALKRDGSSIPIELTVTSFTIEEELYFTAFLRDLTDKRRADAEKESLEERLHQAQKMETMGTLAGGIAHDFNNILTPIVGYLQLLMRKAGDDENLKKSLTRVLKATDKATNLVGQILTFSRQTAFEKKPVLLTPLLEETLRLLQSTIPSSIKFEQKIDPDVPPILADPTRVQQVVMNLCTNAVHAIGENIGTITIELSSLDLNEEEALLRHELDPGEHVKIVIADSGKGMDEETKLKIFDPFFTTKRHSGGTGLGLATSHGIITEMRGAIEVESEPGKGSTFTILIPTTEFEEESLQEEEGINLAGTGTVLLVDDVKENTVLMSEMLETLGYDAVGFNSSQQALQYFKGNPYKVDLILTDQEMPEMTGDVLAREIKAVRPEIPIVLMTGYSEKITDQDQEKIGLADIMQKPISIETLGKVIKGAFQNP